MSYPARILIIAGSDSGGGAGIQGDIKTVQSLGGYAMTAVTALTAQNTQGVFGIHSVPPEFIAQQISLCLDDIGADAIKTGMLHSAEVITAVAQELEGTGDWRLGTGKKNPASSHLPPAPSVPLVVDPVMVAKGGAPLLAEAALQALKTLLIPHATIITPNLPEAEWLLGRAIDIVPDAMAEAAEELLQLGCGAVLLKGGHAITADGSPTAMLTDVLVMAGQKPLRFTAPRIDTRHTHGTGCALASAIATGLGQKLSLVESVMRAHTYVQEAIKRAPGLGQGHGPLGH
jgi:hydroxymethylpyrimidine/phosphomethylpyrimidine kinase